MRILTLTSGKKSATFVTFTRPASAPYGVFKETGMLMMKCYLANTGNGHFITADEAAPGPLTCTSCGCVLYAQPGNAGERQWFME